MSRDEWAAYYTMGLGALVSLLLIGLPTHILSVKPYRVIAIKKAHQRHLLNLLYKMERDVKCWPAFKMAVIIELYSRRHGQ